MTEGVWHKLDLAGRSLTPISVTLCLMLLGMVPVYLPFYGMVVPMLSLMSIYYWVIHRPDLMRPVMAFIIGLLQDVLSGQPVGMSALLFVSAHWLLISQRRFFAGNTFAILWAGFALIAAGAMVIQWLAFCLWTRSLLSLGPALVQMMLTVLLFPVVTWLFVRIHRRFLNA